MARFANTRKRYALPMTALLLAGFFLGGATKTGGLFSDVMAAWVQALGSLAAIWAGVYVYDRQVADRRTEIETERRDRSAASIELMAQLVDAMDALSKIMAGALGPAPVSPATLGRFELFDDMITKVLISDAASPKTIPTAINFRAYLRGIELNCLQYNIAYLSSPQDTSEMAKVSAEVGATTGQMRKEYEQLAAQLRSASPW